MHFTLVSTVSVFTVFLLVLSGSLTQTVKPYEFGFTIEEQQHRHEKRDERGIVMGEFGFITADGIYHVTVYATDEEGKFRILAMRNYPYESPPKTVDMVVVPKQSPITTTTPKPLPKHNFYQEACSGCFLKNGNGKQPATQDANKKTEIRPLSKPISTLTPPNKPLTKLVTNMIMNTNLGKIYTIKTDSNEKDFKEKDIIESVATQTANKVPIKETITNNLNIVETFKTHKDIPNTILPNRIKTQQNIAQTINNIQYKTSGEVKTPTTQQTPKLSTATEHSPNTYVVYKPNSNIKPNLHITPKQIITNQVDYTPTLTGIKTPQQTNSASEQIGPADLTTTIHTIHAPQSTELNKDIASIKPFTSRTNKPSAISQTTNTAAKSRSSKPTSLKDQTSSKTITPTQSIERLNKKVPKDSINKSSAENLLVHPESIESAIKKSTSNEDKNYQIQISSQLGKDITDTSYGVDSSTPIGADKKSKIEILPQSHLTQHNVATTKCETQLNLPNLKTQTLPITPTTQEFKQGTPLLTTTTKTISNKNNRNPSHMKNIAATVVDTVTTIATPIKYEVTKKTVNTKPKSVTPTYTTQATQENTVAHSTGKSSKTSDLLNSAITKTQTGSQVGTKTFTPLNGPSTLNAARTPTGSAPPGANIPPLKTAAKQPNAPSNAITFPQNSIGSTGSQSQSGVNPKFDLRVGNSAIGGGIAGGSAGEVGDLYRFKYILDYNGHTETGSRNGNKEGNYFSIGDDDILRTIEYVANENGYQPRIRWRKLDTKVQSKENTLKDYEFVWFKNN
ncbi:protein lethal(3)malignant blood neoplasm 1 [Teleopsis dalmanni]|uniref:protein lethal(3)malignant blood neoplasm 1 n=1 Tax=Teleopsis dalmanni TaxID=139649 RepID=UPI0018CD8071|nr:protein lethal(3)malignant blood neoplasm 1 [Teleopsis dalmanni]